MYKQQAKSSHMELCRWIMHGAVARIQTTGMPPVPSPRGGGETGTLAFWGFLLFQRCLPLCASEPEPPPRGGGETGT